MKAGTSDPMPSRCASTLSPRAPAFIMCVGMCIWRAALLAHAAKLPRSGARARSAPRVARRAERVLWPAQRKFFRVIVGQGSFSKENHGKHVRSACTS